MLLAFPVPEPSLPAQLGAVLRGLVRAVAETIRPRPWLAPNLLLLHRYLARRIERLALLHHQWQAGTLPPPRETPLHRPDRPRNRTINRGQPPAPDAPLPPLRPRHDWVMDLGWAVMGHRAQLEHLLTHHPETADFLAAAPQAGRLLRPLCRILRIDLPPALRPPPAAETLPAECQNPPRPAAGSPGPTTLDAASPHRPDPAPPVRPMPPAPPENPPSPEADGAHP